MGGGPPSGVLCTVYCVLCTVYCVLCTVYCVLCTVYCVLCTVYCVLCTVYCVLCTVYCVLCTVYCVLCTVYCVLCTVYCVLCTVYCVLCTVYCVLCTVYCVLCTVYCVLCTVYCVLCTVYCVLCTVYCVLCTVYCVLCKNHRGDPMDFRCPSLRPKNSIKARIFNFGVSVVLSYFFLTRTKFLKTVLIIPTKKADKTKGDEVTAKDSPVRRSIMCERCKTTTAIMELTCRLTSHRTVSSPTKVNNTLRILGTIFDRNGPPISDRAHIFRNLRGHKIVQFSTSAPPLILGPPEIYFGHFGRIRGGFRAILCARICPKTPEMQISGGFGRFFLSENRLGRFLFIFAKNFLYLEIFDVKSVKISKNRKLLYT